MDAGQDRLRQIAYDPTQRPWFDSVPLAMPRQFALDECRRRGYDIVHRTRDCIAVATRVDENGGLRETVTLDKWGRPVERTTYEPSGDCVIETFVYGDSGQLDTYAWARFGSATGYAQEPEIIVRADWESAVSEIDSQP